MERSLHTQSPERLKGPLKGARREHRSSLAQSFASRSDTPLLEMALWKQDEKSTAFRTWVVQGLKSPEKAERTHPMHLHASPSLEVLVTCRPLGLGLKRFKRVQTVECSARLWLGLVTETYAQ